MSVKEKMTAIADAIREKTGGTEKLTLDEMPDKIRSINVYPEDGIVVGSYCLAANVNGTMMYFNKKGSVTETKPYSLHVTSDISKACVITLENPISGTEGFQLVFPHPSDYKMLRIYCYDALSTGANAGVMDTGTNAKVAAETHTFFLDEVNGVKVLRKYGNNNVLVVKHFEATGTYRMLGVPESELANEEIYPVSLVPLRVRVYQ